MGWLYTVGVSCTSSTLSLQAKYKEKFPDKEATCFTSSAGMGARPVDLSQFMTSDNLE